ncbi:MAG: DUF421 domain-containing protein [Tatlockia sp.]|nr:DUF421 domain-containing protein [Tatlockia sp.]
MIEFGDLYSTYHIDYYTRAVIVTFFAILLFRVGNTRLVSQLAPYDLVIFIILGALFGTAVIDKKLFVPSLICCSIITLIHRGLGFISTLNPFFAKYFKGERVILYSNSTWHDSNLDSCSLNKDDIFQELRTSLGINTMEPIKRIIMERNGKITFLKHQNQQ